MPYARTNLKLFSLMRFDYAILRKNSTWYQWERNENDCWTEKVEKKANVNELLNMLES